jgi:polyisoprenoid-binding protein YceI
MKLLPRSVPALVFISALLQANAADLTLDARNSWVKFDATATGHSFDGSLKKFDAEVSGDLSSLTPSSANLEWDFKDLDTDEPKRDAEMLKWLDHGKSPKGSFRMSKSWTDAAGKTWVQGTLRIHSISKLVAFPIETSKNGDHVKIDGLVWIDYRDFGLPIVRNMAVMTVDPKLKIRFHLEGDAK